MDVYPSPSFEDVVVKLINFDDKIESYIKNSTVTPHLALIHNELVVTLTTTTKTEEVLEILVVPTEAEVHFRLEDEGFTNRFLPPRVLLV